MMSRVSKSIERLTWFMGVLFCVFMVAGFIVPQDTLSAPLHDLPVTLTQPDGEVLHLFASGDEFHNWLHDADNFTVIQDPVTGFYVYAVEEADGDVAPSIYRVGKVKPAAVGLKQGVNLSPEKIRERTPKIEDAPPQGSPAHPQLIMKAPQTGTINNLVIFIRFSDSAAFTHNSDHYKKMFNSNASGDNSLYNYYWEASYNKLAIDTTFYPAPLGATVLSFQDSHARGYFQPYNAATNPDGYENDVMRKMREHTLLKDAVNAVGSQVPSSLNIDGDNDGRVDNVCFIVQGDAAGWNNLLWPHMWSLFSWEVSINGKRVWTYNFQLETAMDSSGVGVLGHEMFHSLGAPDLYHYTYVKNVSPAWKWDIMQYNMNPPQHMTAYMKMYYGKWLESITPITTSGAYTLKPLTSPADNAYKIASPNSSKEYFVVEYRKKTGTFENSLPKEGLLVYRINTDRSGKGNAGANYDEGIYDELYVYRPGGTTKANGSPNNATFSADSGRTEINDDTNPSSFLCDGSAGGLKIFNVESVGDTISFQVELTSTARPDLQPYKPSGWSDPIVVANKTGTNKDSSALFASDTLYVDCAILNDTSVAIGKPFRVSLYVDEKPVKSWSVSSLNGNTSKEWQDLPVGKLSAGDHEIKIVADTFDAVSETSEKDNTYTKTITVKEAGLANLAPYKPSGWPDKVVVSNVPGTHTDTNLYSDDILYVDWAVTNKGPGDVEEQFTVVLVVDGVKKKTWTRSEGLKAGRSFSVRDFALKPLKDGLHQIKIQVDRGKAILESSESDNNYTRSIDVMK
jgi:M6 family metalloprotease-like protein